MSSNLPLRTIRIPALRQKCLFQQYRHAPLPRAFSTTTPQSFASTSPRQRGGSSLRNDRAMTKAAARGQMGAAPKVNEMKQQQEGVMAEDIGLLQDTVVRASWRKLPAVWSASFWSYTWKLLKSKGTALYSRSMYKRCIYKTGMSSYFCIDAGNKSAIKDKAIKLYTQLYVNFASGDMSSVSRFCLPPLQENFKTRVAARGRLTMDWKLLTKPTARVVSHRASLFGEDQPDTAYRQAVIRIQSSQALSLKGAAARTSNAPKLSSMKGVKWLPAEATTESKNETLMGSQALKDEGHGTRKEVVEYLVLQKRVIRGKEEDWKVWGFTQESTPEKIEEDAAYWRKTLAAQS